MSISANVELRAPEERLFFTPCVGESRAKQSFAKECDINFIMARYQKSGAVTHVNRHGADYGFATSLDFAESMRVVIKGQEMFDDLPSSIRSRFGNQPGAFLEFVQEEENYDEMVELGLIEKPEVVEPVEVSVVAPEAAIVPQGDVVEGDAQVSP